MSGNESIAVVAGRSMAGLAAAATLSRHFSRVVVIDKDPDHDTDKPRPGVGQAHHYHALSQGAMQALERLLPGAVADLHAAGAVKVPFAVGFRFYDAGDWQPNRDLGVTALNAMRGLIELVTYTRLQQRPGVEFRGSCRLERLLFGDVANETGRVYGVEVRAADGSLETIEADLVVDCTGRLSDLSQVLAKNGFDPIEQYTLNIGISYTSAVFRAPADAAGGFAAVAVLPEPPAKRGGFAARVHDDTWIVSLHTRFEKELPKTYQEMVEFAETIEVPDVGEFLQQATLNGEIRSYRKGEAVWRRFDKAERFPEGLLVMGDAIASFNPIFGQGMSVATLQACALDDVLAARAAAGTGFDGISREFFPLAMTISRAAWSSSTAVDSAYDEVTGDLNPNAAQNTKVMRGLRKLVADDPKLQADMLAVGQMTAPGDRLMTPELLERALAAADGA